MPQNCDPVLESYLLNNCATTAPGLSDIKLTYKKWLDTYPTKDAYDQGVTPGLEPNTISTDLTLDTVTYTSAAWHTLQGTPEKYQYNSEMQGDIGSKYYTSGITWFIPGEDPLVTQIIDDINNQECIVLFRYKSTRWRLLGSPQFPAFIYMTKEDSGAARGDTPGYELKAEVPLHDRAFAYYTGTVPS